MDDDLRLLVLRKSGGETYTFLWDRDHQLDVLKTFGRFAADPALSFTWADAAWLSARVQYRSGRSRCP